MRRVERGHSPRPLARGSFLPSLVLVTVSSLVALGAGEVLVRLFAPQQLILKLPDVWQPVDTLGWVHRAGVDAAINTGERTVRFLTNERGFRIGSVEPVAARWRVLLLGDSFMEAMQVEYEQSTAGRLEMGLAQRLGAPVVVRNTAVAEWTPSHYLLQAREALPGERFHLVLVTLYLGNDIVPTRLERIPPRPPVEVHPLRLPRRLTMGEFVEAIAYPINDFLEVRSHLFIFFKRRGEALLMRLGLVAEYFPAELMRREAGSPRWVVTANICRDIAEVARQHGLPTLFVLLPTPFQVDREEFWRFVRGFGIDPATVDLEQPNRLVAAELRARGLRFVDVLPAFRDAHRAGRRLYGRVDRHLSPAGHELLARVLEPIVAEYLGHGAGVASTTMARP
jgi:hypothetical protein